MTRIAFIGAGSAVFTRQLLRDLLTYDDLPSLELVLHDLDPDRLRLAEWVAQETVRHHDRAATVVATDDRRRAVAGADFVINTVNIGGHAATVTDFDVPERFGVRQTIGDTLGVGGIFRALRTFPFLDALAAEIRELAPEAWLLNYTNPMAMNIGYLARRHPDVRALGLCHSVHWTMHGLARLIGVPLDEITFRAAGVNHQAWILDWQRGDEDLYPRLDKAIAADPEQARRVRVDMYRRLGRFPTESSEHGCEYVPWYLHDDAEVDRLRIPLRDYVGISAANAAEIEDLVRSGPDVPYVEPDDEAAEYAPEVIHSLVTGTEREIYATVPNSGLIDNLPTGAPVEVPVALGRHGVRPVPVGELPAQCAALNSAFLQVVELTVRAAVEEWPELVRHALMVDPNTAATLDVGRIWDLADAMVAAHGDLLPVSLRGSVPLR